MTDLYDVPSSYVKGGAARRRRVSQENENDAVAVAYGEAIGCARRRDGRQPHVPLSTTGTLWRAEGGTHGANVIVASSCVSGRGCCCTRPLLPPRLLLLLLDLFCPLPTHLAESVFPRRPAG